MYSLHSSLSGRKLDFASCRECLKVLGFTLNAEWDYDHGYFDCSLEETLQVFVRIPFRSKNGKLDREQDGVVLLIELGKPFVLVHRYQDKNDPTARVKLLGALIDQFQDPIEADADVEQQWIDKAKPLIRQVENELNKIETTNF